MVYFLKKGRRHVSDIEEGRQGETGGISDGTRHGTDSAVYECGDGGRDQGRRCDNGLKGDRDAGAALEHLSPACSAGRSYCEKAGRTAPFYELG